MNFEKPQDESIEKAPVPKIVDRRQKLAPKVEVPKSEDELFLEQAERELSQDGKAHTPEEIHNLALKIKFSGMQSNTLEDQAVEEYVKAAAEKFNTGMKTEGVIRRSKEDQDLEQARKVEEVERVREEMSRKTAEAIEKAKAAKTGQGDGGSELAA